MNTEQLAYKNVCEFDPMCANSANAQIYIVHSCQCTQRPIQKELGNRKPSVATVRRGDVPGVVMDNLFDESSFVRNRQEKIHICIQFFIYITH